MGTEAGEQARPSNVKTSGGAGDENYDMGPLVALMTTVTLAFAGCGGQPQGESTFPEGLTAVRELISTASSVAATLSTLPLSVNHTC